MFTHVDAATGLPLVAVAQYYGRRCMASCGWLCVYNEMSVEYRIWENPGVVKVLRSKP